MTVDSEDDIRWENDCWNMLEPSKINSKFMRLDYPTWNIFNILWGKKSNMNLFLVEHWIPRRLDKSLVSSKIEIKVNIFCFFKDWMVLYLRAAAPAADPGRTERIPEANPAWNSTETWKKPERKPPRHVNL